ncbi:TonB-dependent receptor [Litorivivens sp.]|uniref:TonB-dependent receptor n=1 Tax=Litorivivens sp. TaxID=2020868 RepID=UPI00356A3055
MTKGFSLERFFIGSLLSTGFLQPFALAYDAGSGRSAALEEVIVTAQKREQRLQDVPLAVTAVGREMLEDAEVNTIEDLTKVMPAVRLTPDGNTNAGSINMRGIGTNVFSIAIEPNVSVMLDGVVLARNSLANFDFVDIERIEILRGPQGTLFGKNASAGLIHVLTRDPSDDFEARLRYSYEQPETFAGNFSKIQLTGSGALTDTSALRLTGFYKEQAGHYEDIEQDNHNPDSRQFGVRSKLLWRLSERLEARWNLEFVQRKGDSAAVPWISANPQLRERMETIEPSRENIQVRTLGNNRSDSRGNASSLSLDWELDNHVITSLTGHRQATYYSGQSIAALDGKRTDLVTNLSRYDLKTITQELRILSTHSDTLEYTAGALWFDNDISEDFYRDLQDLPAQFAVGNAVPATGQLLPQGLLAGIDGNDGLSAEAWRNSTVTTKNLGIFAEATWHLADDWHLTLGGRYIDEQVDVKLSNASRLSHTNSGAALIEESFPLSSATVSDTTATGKLSVLHNLSDDHNIYASITSGYRGAAFDVIADDAANALRNPVDPEKALSYEIGAKTRWLDNRLSLNLTAFLTTFEDFQAQVRDLTDATSVVAFRLDNAGELKTSGIELEFQYKPAPEWTITGTYLYNEAIFEEFITQCFYGQQPGEAGGRDVDGDGSCDEQDVSGGSLANAPEHSATLSTRYDHYFAGGQSLYGQLSGRYQSQVQFSNEQHPGAIEDAYQLWDLRAGWLGAGAKFEAALYVKNLSDTSYLAVITPLSLVNDRRDYVGFVPASADRTFGLSLAYRWGN